MELAHSELIRHAWRVVSILILDHRSLARFEKLDVVIKAVVVYW